MSQIHRETTFRTPAWVKILGVLLVALLVIIGIILLSGGEHGPGRHMPPTAVTENHVAPIDSGAQHP